MVGPTNMDTFISIPKLTVQAPHTKSSWVLNIPLITFTKTKIITHAVRWTGLTQHARLCGCIKIIAILTLTASIPIGHLINRTSGVRSAEVSYLFVAFIADTSIIDIEAVWWAGGYFLFLADSFEIFLIPRDAQALFAIGVREKSASTTYCFLN